MCIILKKLCFLIIILFCFPIIVTAENGDDAVLNCSSIISDEDGKNVVECYVELSVRENISLYGFKASFIMQNVTLKKFETVFSNQNLKDGKSCEKTFAASASQTFATASKRSKTRSSRFG